MLKQRQRNTRWRAKVTLAVMIQARASPDQAIYSLRQQSLVSPHVQLTNAGIGRKRRILPVLTALSRYR